jgi:hypothetical protein
LSTDYEHDIFFSYKRHELTLNWTRQVAARLKLWLTEELNRPAEVFIDESSIEVGQKWPDELKYALKHSRCIVCVWSPSYFQSSWCVSEWKSFLEREKLCAVQAYRLIAPLKFHDGEHFPQEASNVQWEDVAEYAFTIPAFWDSQRAIELEAKLKTFAHSVANMVRKAPPFDRNWPIVEREGAPAPGIVLAKL